MRMLELTKGYSTIVDDDDYDRVSAYKWTAMVTGKHIKRVYAYRREGWNNAKRKWENVIYMHRFILKPPDGIDIDHIDGNTLDNQKVNLRCATRSQNLANNRRKIGAAGYRGVTIDRRDGAIIAQCGIKYLGRYKTLIDAALAYDMAALERFGEFAKLNFPDVLTGKTVQGMQQT